MFNNQDNITILLISQRTFVSSHHLKRAENTEELLKETRDKVVPTEMTPFNNNNCGPNVAGNNKEIIMAGLQDKII